MTGHIIHHQRLAWDCARAFVALTETEREYSWLSPQLGRVLGAERELALADTRGVLLRQGGEAVSVEVGRWRARIDDLLFERPDVRLPLGTLVRDAMARAAARYPIAS
jgi:hypothetical protein